MGGKLLGCCKYKGQVGKKMGKVEWHIAGLWVPLDMLDETA